MRKLSKSIICLILSVMMIFSFVACQSKDVTDETTTIVESTSSQEETTKSNDDSQTEEVTISDEVQDLADDTKELVENGEDIASNEIIEGSISEEKELEQEIIDEDSLENDGTVEQENISYDGANDEKGTSLLGACTGLTYYSQRDSRWGSVLYTSTNNKSQTISSSGCGPTSAAMVVSSSKGAILPTTMAKIFVDNGFRTKDNGTAWSCWSFVADYFEFKEYYTTSNFETMLKYLRQDNNNDGISDYFVVVSCHNGLFTSSGHYVVIVADNNYTMTVYDPYPYTGKYDTASRKVANAKVSGNNVYVTESNFKKYAGYNQFFIFSNDHTTTETSTSNKTTSTKVNYTRYVATQSSPLNVRYSASSSAKIVDTLSKGTKVTVTEVNGSWSKIGTNRWVSSAYLSTTSPTTKTTTTTSTSKVTYKTTVGNSYKFTSATNLYSKGNLSGTEYNYKSGTVCKVISHYSDKVDYVYISATGRYAYVSVDKLTATSTKTSTTTTVKNTVGNYYRLKGTTTLYSNSNLSGTQYQYVAQTQVKVLKNISSSVDYVQVVKTGRKAYVKVSSYK